MEDRRCHRTWEAGLGRRGKTLSLGILPRHDKSREHASNAHRNLLCVYINLLYKTVFLLCQEFLPTP